MPSGNKKNDSDPGLRDRAVSPGRRDMLKVLALGGTVGLAGCSSGGGGGGGNGDNKEKTKNANKNKGKDTSDVPLSERSHGGHFIKGDTSPASDLNPLKLGEGATSDRLSYMFDAGWDRSGPKESEWQPRWIESWEISDSLDVVEVKLRENLQYSDKWGQLTAEDYLYNINNIFLSEWYPYTYQANFTVGTGKNEQPVKYEKTGKYTIREELPESRPFWPYNDPLGYVIPVPKKLLEPYVKKKDAKGLDKDPQVFKSLFSGNLGPWSLKEWNRQSVVVYEPSKDYYLRKWAKKDDRVDKLWSEAPFFDKLSVQLFGEESTMRSALKSGDIHRSSISGTKLSNFKNQKDVTIFENPYISYSDYTGINHRVNGWAPLRNKKVRWALANLYNRNFVVDTILKGRGSTQGTLYPQWGKYYPDKKGIKKFDWTVERAKQLLKEGTPSEYGYSGDKFVDGKGEQVELSCVYQSGTIDDLRAQYLKKRLGQAGIKLKLVSTKWSNLLQTYFTTKFRAEDVPKDAPIGYGPDGKKHPSRYNWGPWDKAVSKKPWDLMLTLGFEYGPLDPSGTVAALFAEKENFNAYGYTPSKPLAEMRQKAKTAETTEKASSLIEDMFALISKEQPVIFESNYYGYTGYQKDVQGQPTSPAKDYFVEQNMDWMFFSSKK
jgi:peptide/nickel transport system substrate-binding protein